MPGHLKVARRPLAQEVVQTLRESLCRQPEGMRLPSECELARQLGVSMTTLRKALPELLASGEIVRSGRKSFVGRPGPSRGGPEGMHSFLLAQTHPPRPAAILDLVTYEHLPAQRHCWGRVAEQFNAAHADLQLRLIDLPHEVNTTAHYVQYVRENKIALAMFGNMMLPDLSASGLLKSLPEDVSRWQGSDESLWSTLCSDPSQSGGPGDAVALHTSFPLLAWNTALTGDGEATPRDPVEPAAAVAWLGDMAQHIPPGRSLMASPAKILALAGCQSGRLGPGDVRRAIRGVADLAERLLDMDRSLFRFHSTDGHFSFRAFARGETAVTCGPSFLLLDALRAATFPWRAVPGISASPYRLWQGATMVGVTTDDADLQADAAEAMRFLISPQAQSTMAEGPLNCPMRKESVAPLARFLGLSPDAFLEAMSRLHVSGPRQQALWVWFIHSVAMPYIDGILEGAERPDRETMIAWLEDECRRRVPKGLPVD